MRVATRSLLSLAALLLAAGGAARAAPEAAAAPLDGVWTEQNYSFSHLGFTSTYSCDGLADKLKVLLQASGARADISANPVGCGFGQPSKFARVNLKFYTLKPAGQPARAGEPAAPAPGVAGVWKAIALSDRVPRDLARGDCELVEEFRDWLLPLFATRAVEDGLRCVPFQLSGGDIRLSFESFVAAPAPAAAPPSQARP